jgi:hemerythrin superfamily protein
MADNRNRNQNDIIDELLAQHQQIKLLFAQVEVASGENKEKLFQELVGLLAVHETVEETLVHPLAQRELDNGDRVVQPRLAEEQSAKEALSRLYDLGVADPRFDAGLAELRDAVTAHAEAEETQEFSRLRATVDPEKLRRMVTAMDAVEKVAPTRPHPEVPPKATANLLLGPPLAVFDRVRDALHAATSGRKERT